MSGVALWCEILGHHFSFHQLPKSPPPFKWSERFEFDRHHCSFSKFLCFLASLLTFSLSSLFVPSRYSFSLIMSSFLSDSSVGMGGNDSGDLIEQTMMDQEVISIGGSSSEDTCCGVSDSKSSSLERVKALCCTGGGTSHPRLVRNYS